MKNIREKKTPSLFSKIDELEKRLNNIENEFLIMNETVDFIVDNLSCLIEREKEMDEDTEPVMIEYPVSTPGVITTAPVGAQLVKLSDYEIIEDGYITRPKKRERERYINDDDVEKKYDECMKEIKKYEAHPL